jgi:carbonic anhydrase
MVQEATEERGLQIHGWVFDVSDGLVKPLEVTPGVPEAEYQTMLRDKT